MNFRIAAITTVFLLSALQAQVSRVAPAMSIVPLWPQSGDTSNLADGVYYDPPHLEYVAFCKCSAAAGETGTPIVLRFASHAGIMPQISSVVSATAEGFKYTYTISNDVMARQPIREVQIAIDPGPIRISHPWWSGKQHLSNATGLHPSATVDWTPKTPDQAITAGGAVSGLVIESASLPGFVSVIFKGATPSSEYSEDSAAALPDAIRKQLALVFTDAADGRAALTIGPRFPKGTPPFEVAHNFFTGMNALIHSQKLDQSSAFVQSTMDVLSRQIQSGDEVSISVSDFAFGQAKPGLETTIANALKTSLGE